MLPRPEILDTFAHPRIAWFVLEGVALSVIGVLLWFVGQIGYDPFVSLSVIAFVVGVVTVLFGFLGYLIVAFSTPD